MAEPIEEIPTKTFAPGDVIFREGDESQSEAYLVHEGTVEARRRVDGEERVLNTLVKGDLLGEVALFRDAPHSVTAIAVEQVTLLVIPAQRLESMVRAIPSSPSGLFVNSPAWPPIRTTDLTLEVRRRLRLVYRKCLTRL